MRKTSKIFIILFVLVLIGCSSSYNKYNAKPPKENKYAELEEPCDGLKLKVTLHLYDKDFIIEYNIDEYKIENNIKGQSILTLYGPCGMIVFFPMDNVEYIKFREL